MQTLREVLDKWRDDKLDYREERRRQAVCVLQDAGAWLGRDINALLDLRIIDGAAVALDLEAGVDAAKQSFNHVVEPAPGEIAIDLYSFVRAILSACMPNIIVPDEVVEIDEPLWPVSIPTKDGPTCLSNGDTITITRERKETHGQQENTTRD